MEKRIKPIDSFKGEIAVPGDKSISHRAVFIGSISSGVTEAQNFLEAEDCLSTVSAFRNMGIEIAIRDKKIFIKGQGLKGLKKPSSKLYIGNSGTTMRILPGILAGQDFSVTLTGDQSLSKRPMQRIIDPLKKMGVDISSGSAGGETPPLMVKGGEVKPIKYSTRVASAQVKSCIIFAGLYAGGTTSVTEPYVSRDHTERLLEFFGAKISRDSFTVSVSGSPELSGQKFFVPGDISSAAFFIAASCILSGSEITIKDVGLNDTRLGFLRALSRMGASISIENRKDQVEPYGDVRVKYAPLKATVIEKAEIPFLIDEIPILAVIASRAEGRTVIRGINELRIKETDRVFSVVENLKSMGVDIISEGDDMVINGGNRKFKSAKLDSFKDHRTAMSMSIAALCADGECLINDTECINTSFPSFYTLVDSLKQ
ncbi:MAG: 3-phosphoshikimate 1-carboxyvinyltransferase [Candidatus Tantalella remota]|nr:3-phosphoshikimate 1-carboxyvinyltransferase [Candidatus Tantalella remota]